MDPTNSIYLDYNATTPIDPSVAAAMADVQARVQANPASPHRAGRQAKRVLEDAAEEILTLLGAETDHAGADRIILTSGGTEANNLALLGSLPTGPGRLLVSSIEHPSTTASARRLQHQGWQVDWIRTLECGTVDIEHLKSLLNNSDDPPRFVSVMLGNNETGVMQPVRDIVDLCEPRGIPVHTDAVQAVGKIPVSFSRLGVTLMTVAAHKFHGPVGIGGLLVRGKTPLQPILLGGAQQLGSRPGTESVALAVGMRTALQRWHQRADPRALHMATCRDRLQDRLTTLPDVVVNGTAPRLPNTLNLSFLGIDRQALLMALDMAGVYASTGSACASGSSEPSLVLQAMGLSNDRVQSALRLSIGATTRIAEVNDAADRILKAVNQLRA